MSEKNADAYWRSNLKIVLSLLAVWFFISFFCGILIVDFLDNFRFGGFKLGFWIAQQGSIYVFVVLIFVYIKLMDRLDSEFGIVENNEAAAQRSETAAQKGEKA